MAHVFGTTVTQSLATTDCEIGDGFLFDLYRFTVPQGTGAIRVNEASTAFDAFLLLYDAQGRLVAFSDDSSGTSRNASARVLAAPGTYFVEVSSYDVQETGTYTFSTAAVSQAVAGCADPYVGEEVFVTLGVTTAQEVETTDCAVSPPGAGGTYYSDRFLMLLEAGRSATIRMSSTAIDPYLSVYQLTATQILLVEENDNGGGGTTAQVTVNAQDNMVLLVDAGTEPTGQTGAYSLSVQSPTTTAQLSPGPGATARNALRTFSASKDWRTANVRTAPIPLPARR
jgi:hypothetical protein